MLQSQILTPVQMYESVVKNIQGIHFLFAAKEDVKLHRCNMTARFESVQTVLVHAHIIVSLL